MKVFQIYRGFCHWQTPYKSLSDIPENSYAPDVVFVETSDEVHEGWGYVDGQCIPPTPPEGWVYDGETNTFSPTEEKKVELRALGINV